MLNPNLLKAFLDNFACGRIDEMVMEQLLRRKNEQRDCISPAEIQINIFKALL